MHTIIAGSRGFTDYNVLLWCVAILDAHAWKPSVIISGGARGADVLGERYARECRLPLVRLIPDWDGKGKSAGHIRNLEMASRAHFLIALWDGQSPGTRDMIRIAQHQQLPALIYRGDTRVAEYRIPTLPAEFYP